MKHSPEEMYRHSIRTGRKLPDELHEAMLLWSFDPKQEGIVKEYLVWVKTCEEREKYRSRMDKRMRSIESTEKVIVFMMGMFAAASITLAFLY